MILEFLKTLFMEVPSLTLSRRELRGLRIVTAGGVRQVDQGMFLVHSQSDSEEWYEVSWSGGRWHCSCEDYAKRERRCKHICAVNYYLMLREVTSGVRSLNRDVVCPVCNSGEHVVRSGYRYNRTGPVQRYYCKRCERWFVDPNGFEGMKHTATVIAMALDLYCRGLSLRQIADHIHSLHGFKVSYGAIYYWLKKYVDLVHRYVNGLPAQTSERWHADETVLKISGRDLLLWSLLDSETRFLIALHISRRKAADEAEALLKEGLEKSEKKPWEIITDGNPSYDKAIEEGAKNQKASDHGLIHIRGPLVGPITNNKIERFNGTVKKRVKAMYHLNSEGGAETFAKGYAIHYNFIKPHRALNYKTPAEKAGLSEKSNWIRLIMKARKNQNKQQAK